MVIKNMLKKSGVFICRHPAHRQFGYGVSPYHILSLNKCWPDGCIEFLWRCHQFEKGQSCPRKYKHVGRGCASCKHYHEIKGCYSPSSDLDDSELKSYMRDLAEYIGWIEEMNDRTVRFSGVFESIKPHFEMRLDKSGESIRMDGFFASFACGHLDRYFFDDRLYLSLGSGFLRRYNPAPGDEIECDAIFHNDRGRVLLNTPRRIEINRNGGKSSLNFSKALVGRATGKIIKGDIDYCRGCEHISLVDIDDARRSKPVRYRRYYCLRGISEPEHCPVRLGLLPDSDPKTESGKRF